jgi:MSHA type pilus biogenesis protein MshL
LPTSPAQPAPPPPSAALKTTNIAASMTATSAFPLPRFEPWPTPPPRLAPSTAPATEKSAPGPTIPEAAQDKTLYSFRAENLDLKTALALFARANKLNIVPDQDVSGQVTLDVQDLPLERMMQALIEAHDFTWTEEGGLIRVRATQTRSFILDYLRLTREGHGSSAVTLSSSSTSGSGVSGLGGGGGIGGGGLGGGGVASSGTIGSSGSQMNLTLENPVEFWKELDEQLKKLLTPVGKENLAINSTAGIIHITDRPSAVKRVQQFLQQLTHCVSRQVDIEIKLYDVTLGDQFQFGIDWQRVVFTSGGQFHSLASPFGDPSDLNLTRVPFLQPGGGFNIREPAITLLFSNKNTTAILQALQEQGEVTVISQPRLRALNNQTAIMKVGTDQPFFTRQSQVIASGGGQTSVSGDQVSIITVGTVLALTPQISDDGWISLDVTPAITSFVETKVSPSRESSAPVLDIKQSSTIVRLRDGETIVMGGLIQTSTAKSIRKIPLLGDIPLLGKLFQGHFDAKQKKELVIFLTPTIVQ